MKLVLKGTIDEVHAQVMDLAMKFGSAGCAPVYTKAPELDPALAATLAPAAAPKKGPGRPPKAPVDTTASKEAAPPAPPAPAEPTGGPKSMMPLCDVHAKLAPANVKAIPAEPAACVKCAEAAKGPPAGKTAPHTMTLEQVKAVATQLGESRDDGWPICWGIIQSFGAENLTGLPDKDGKPMVGLDPARYEEFAKACLAAMPVTEAAPKRRSL